MIDTGSHSCCSAPANISVQKDIGSIFARRFSSRRLHFVPLSRSRFVPIFTAPFTVHYRAQIVHRLSEEGRDYLIDGDANCRNRCLFIRTFAANCDLSHCCYVCIYLNVFKYGGNLCSEVSHRVSERIPTQSSLFISILFINRTEKAFGFFMRGSFCLSWTSALSLFSVFSHLRKAVAI